MLPRLGRLTLPVMAVTLGMLAMLAAGCSGPGNSGPALAKSQVFHFNLPTGGSGDIKTMDPGIVTDANSMTVIYLVFDGLVTLDKELKIEKWGATRWDVSPDGLSYTFHLRSGQSFSNGKPVTAKDYAYSMERSLNPCLASPVAYYLWELKDASTFSNETCKNGVISMGQGQTTPVIQTLIGDSINTPDDQTLQLTLAQPAAYFLEAMTYPTSYAVEPSVVGSDITAEKWTDTLSQGASGQGGSGMFYVSSWNHQAGKIVLKQNPHWWGLSQGKKPHLTEIDFTEFKNADTSYAAYQAGQFDNGYPTTQLLAHAKSSSDFHQIGTLTYYGIDFNWNKPPFNSLDARAAFCLAVNRDALNHAIEKDSVLPHWNIVPKGMPGYDPSVTGPDGVTATAGDQAKAASHWQAYTATLAGKTAPAVQFLYVAGSTSQKQLAEALQSQWQQALGVTVTLKGEDVNSWLNDQGSGNFIVTRFDWIDDYPDPQDFLTLLFSTGAQYNSQGASVPAADALMTKADGDPNQTERMQLYNQAEQLLVNQVATCPMWQTVDYYQVRSWAHGYLEDGSSSVPNDAWVAMYIAQH